MIRNSIVGDL